MPKGHKRKNAGVGVDFKKAKHKVGKTLAKAENATDTTVKSKAILLPEQSITADKSGIVVTYRHLSLKDLLGKCGHYNEKVRLDALHGLTELLRASPQEARHHAAALVTVTAERVADHDASCRTAFRELLHKAMLPALGRDSIQPFVPVLMAHVCAAMTHLSEPIRVDALGTLGVLMDWRADLIAAGYLSQVLQHFADALARPARGRSLKAGSLGALLTHVSGLRTFLSKALAASSGQTPAAAGVLIEPNNNNNIIKYHQFESSDKVSKCTTGEGGAEILAWQRCSWPDPSPFLGRGIDDGLGPTTPDPHPDDVFSSGGAADVVASRRLLDLLLDCWRECSPAELETHADGAHAQCATAILQCCNLLMTRWDWGLAIARSFDGPGNHSAKILPRLIIERVSVHFPIHHPSIQTTPALRDQLVALNVAAAQLLVSLLPYVIISTTSKSIDSNTNTMSRGCRIPDWTMRLVDWLSLVIATGDALPPAAHDIVNTGPLKSTSYSDAATTRGGEGEGGGGVTAAVYAAALDAVSSLLPHLPPPRRRHILAAVWALWERTPAHSAARARALSFFAALLEKPASSLYAALPPYGEPLVLQEEAAVWVSAMPRFLWELGSSSPSTTSIALKVVLDAARFSPPYGAGGRLDVALGTLQSQLCALFVLELEVGPSPTPPNMKKTKRKQSASRSSGKAHRIDIGSDGGRGKNKRLIPGPLASMPVSVQSLAVDVMFHLPGLPETFLRTVGLVAVAAREYYPTETALRLIDVASMKAEHADPELFWGLLLTLLSGRGGEGKTELEGAPKKASGASTKSQHKEVDPRQSATTSSSIWKRHATVCEAAVRAALDVAGCADAALAALGPHLMAGELAPPSAAGSLVDVEAQVNESNRLYGGLCLYAAAEGAQESAGPLLGSCSDAAPLAPPAWDWNVIAKAIFRLVSSSIEADGDRNVGEELPSGTTTTATTTTPTTNDDNTNSLGRSAVVAGSSTGRVESAISVTLNLLHRRADLAFFILQEVRDSMMTMLSHGTQGIVDSHVEAALRLMQVVLKEWCEGRGGSGEDATLLLEEKIDVNAKMAVAALEKVSSGHPRGPALLQTHVMKLKTLLEHRFGVGR